MDTIFPKIGIARLGRRDNGVVGMLCPVEKQVILTRRQTDSVREAVVDEGWNSLFADECTAAETTDAVGAVGARRQRDGMMHPVDEIRARRVPPMNLIPVGGLGVVLVEEVISPISVDCAVDVVHPR